MTEMSTETSTLRETIEEAIERRPKNYRAGQAAFNALHEITPGWANAIRASGLDPFHVDERIPAFLLFCDALEAIPETDG